MTKRIDFSDLAPQSMEFEWGGQSYVLHEPTAGVVRKYQNEQSARLKYSSTGEIAGVSDIGDMDPLLVSMCVKTTEGNAIPKSVIESWPSKLVSRLAKEVKAMGDLESATDSIFETLGEAFDTAPGPISKQDFADWILSLKNKKYELLVAEVKAWDEEDPKE